jgi:predicted nucleic acid-binding protein
VASSGTLVDANVLLDLVTGDDPVWAAWSLTALTEARREGHVAINPIVYAEISIRYDTAAQCDQAFPESQLERLPLPWEAAFLAGKAFVEYRRAGGNRTSPLPDFFIGAHAVVARLRLLTRDPARYRSYFPSVELIAP